MTYRGVFLVTTALWAWLLYVLFAGLSYHPAYGYAADFETALSALVFSIPVALPALLPSRPGRFALILLSSSCLLIGIASLCLLGMTAFAWLGNQTGMPTLLKVFLTVTSVSMLTAVIVALRVHLRWSIIDGEKDAWRREERLD